MTVPKSVRLVKFVLHTREDVDTDGRVVTRLNLHPEILNWRVFSHEGEPVLEWAIYCEAPYDGDLFALEARLLEAIRGEP